MKKKRMVFSLLTAFLILATFLGTGLCANSTRIILPAAKNVNKGAESTAITFYVPETIYLTPALGSATAFQYYVDCDSNGTLNNSKSKTTGSVYFYCAQSTSVEISCSGAVVSLGASSGATTLDTTITNGALTAGINQGQTSTITWTATYMVNGVVKTAKAYTVCYAPIVEPVACSIRTYNNDGGYLSEEYVADLQGWAYISGVHGYTTGGNYRANASGSYILAPLLGTVTPPVGDVACATWFTSASGGGTYYTSHAQGDDYFTSVQNSPAGSLTVDTSRYTNLNQIPNLTCGFALTYLKHMDRINWYVSDFNATNAGWHYTNMTSTVNADQNAIFRDTEYPVIFSGSNTVIPELSTGIKLADSNVWSQSITGTGTQLMRMKAAAWAQNTDPIIDEWNCIIMLVNTNVTKVSKDTLRANVRYYTNLALQASEFSSEPDDFAAYEAELKAAAERLGNPTQTVTSDLIAEKYSELNKFNLQYNANGGEGAPWDQIKEYNVNIFLSSTIPSKSYDITFNTNGGEELNPANQSLDCQFSAWNTNQDGSGISFAAGAVFSLNQDTTLYAQWVNPLATNLPLPVRDGYTFLGWFTEDIGGTQITDSTEVTSDGVFFAHWGMNYSIDFNANGGSGAPSSQIKVESIPLSLSSDIPSTPKTYELTYNANEGMALSPDRKTLTCGFNGWNTAPDGSGTDYSAGSQYILNESATLYAQWSIPEAGPLPSPVRNGYTFKGWFTLAQEGFAVTSSTLIDEDTVIFARWDIRKLTNLVITNEVIKKDYYVGDTLDTTGLSLQATYDNGEEDTVTSGFVCGPTKLNKAGSQIIAVVFEGVTRYFYVNVTAVTLTGITVNSPPQKTVYNRNEPFSSAGLTLTATYNNGSTKIIDTGFTAAYDFSVAGTQTVELSYTEGGVTVQTNLTVTVIVNNIVGGDPVTANAGLTVNIPVKITGNQGLMGFSVNVGYDASVFTPVSVSGGALLAGGMLNDSIATAQPGQFKVVWTGSEDVTGDGILFTVTFSVNANAIGNKSITLSYNQADTFNEVWQDVVLNCSDIAVTVNNPNYVPPPALGAGPAAVTAGDNLSLPVSITNHTGMSAFKISLTYDPAFYTYVSVSKGPALLTGDVTASAVNGVLSLTWTGTCTDGVIFTPVFRTAEYKQGRHDIALSYDTANTVFATPGTVMLCSAVEVTLINPYMGQSAWVQADSVQAYAGETVSVPVRIYNNRGLMGFGITVQYDPAVLTPLSAGRGEVTAAGMFDSTLGPGSNGSFKVIWNNTGDVSANGAIMVLTFAVNENAANGETPLTLTYTQTDTFNETWEDVVLDCRASTISIADVPVMLAAKAGSTTVMDRNNGLLYGLQPGMNVSELLTQYLEPAPPNTDIVVTGSMGTGTKVELIDLGSGATLDSITILIFGDVNGDGNIDTSDAGLIIDYENFLLDWDPVTDAVLFKAADLNGDGNVDSSDAGIIVDIENFLLTVDQTTGLAVPVI